MEYWEFLLQKDGDRSWLPLESPNVEILEGRYRIVARSSRINANVEVRITHHVMDEHPPRRRVQMRSNRTNHDGLMVVIPFTQLKPGIWQLSCAGDVMSDLMGNSWKYAVQLQVLPAESEVEDWEPGWADDTGASQAPEPVEEPANGVLRLPHLTEVSNGNGVAPDDRPAMPLAEPVIAEENLTPVNRQSELLAEDWSDLPLPQADPDEVTVASDDRASELEDAPVTSVGETPTESLPPEVSHEINLAIGSSMSHFLEVAEQMSQQLIDQVLRDLDQEPDDIIQPSPQSELLNEPTEQPSASVAELLELANATADLSIPAGMDLESGLFFTSPNQTLEPAPSAPPSTPASTPAIAGTPSLSLTLTQEAYTARRGQPFILPGQIHSAEATNESVATDPATLAGELRFCLRDPQTSEILVNTHHSLPEQPLPITFTSLLEIPAHCKTRLILGEIGLFPAGADADTVALATQSFMVTMDVDELLNELARLNQALVEEVNEEPVELPPTTPEVLAREKLESTYLNLSFLSADEAPVVNPPVRFASLAGQPLPPKLYQPDLEQLAQKPLELPTFPTDRTSAIDSPTEIADDPAVDAALDRETEEEIVPDLAAIALPDLEQTDFTEMAALTPEVDGVPEPESTSESETDALLALIEDTAESDAVESAEAAIEATPEPETPPEVADFQSLNLQQRFWTRLNSLATDAELSRWLKRNLSPSAFSTVEPESQPFPVPMVTRDDSDPMAREIVVDDDPPVVSPRSRTAPAVKNLPEASNGVLSVEADPVPTPMLDVTGGELIAGETITVRVRLPLRSQRIYAKLWLNDCQTRLLLDGPRWLVDFLPTGFGEVEASVQVTIPPGSLEIRFEAIALEMQTQRESHKVTVTRRVIPPDLPSLSLDEFDA